MDPNDAFSAAHPFRWDLGPPAHSAPPAPPPPPPPPLPLALPAGAPRELEDLVAGYGVRPSTVARISELGFTASTLLGMTERELDDMMAALAGLFRWDVLLGERFGLRAALRAERGRVMSLGVGGRFHAGSTLDAASQEGSSVCIHGKRTFTVPLSPGDVLGHFRGVCCHACEQLAYASVSENMCARIVHSSG
jgi:hypothetical protein